MKHVYLLVMLLIIASCKETPKETMPEPEAEKTEMTTEKEYPEALSQVFDAHGGLDTWKSKRTLSFTIPKPDAPEANTIDLYSRKDKIEMPGVSMGFDGKEVWLKDMENAYEGNAAVYHNLMFYFYAMPFVLADDGIKYGDAEPLEYEGKSYPGIHISYNDGVGASPKDDYFLYYDSETYQMAWLGYTFTFGSDEKSDKVSYIRYADWAEVDGVKLPENLTWYANEGSTIKEAKDPVPFTEVSLSETAKPDGFYEMPAEARTVE